MAYRPTFESRKSTSEAGQYRAESDNVEGAQAFPLGDIVSLSASVVFRKGLLSSTNTSSFNNTTAETSFGNAKHTIEADSLVVGQVYFITVRGTLSVAL